MKRTLLMSVLGRDLAKSAMLPLLGWPRLGGVQEGFNGPWVATLQIAALESTEEELSCQCGVGPQAQPRRSGSPLGVWIMAGLSASMDAPSAFAKS